MASEREILLLGVLNQLNLSGKINYETLARDIGAPTAMAARLRWFRFRDKLRSSTGASPTKVSKPSGVKKNVNSPAKKVKGMKKQSSEEAALVDDALDKIEDVPDTPVRRMPTRKARVVALLALSSPMVDKRGIQLF